MRRLVGVAVLEATVLRGGLRNTNYKLRLAGEEPPAVLRLYTAEAAACGREVALRRLVGARVPVAPGTAPPTPRPTHSGHCSNGLTASVSTRCSFRPRPTKVQQACRSAGEVLTAIHGFTLAGRGFVGPNLEIREPMGYAWLTGVEAFFAAGPALAKAGLRCSRVPLAAVRSP